MILGDQNVGQGLLPPSLQRRMIAENRCHDVIELDTDHTPQLSMTKELAAALHRFANHLSAATF